MKIVNIGSLNLDRIYHLDHIVLAGETQPTTQANTVCGGKGLNQSVAVAKAGGTVLHAGKIGRDGAALREALVSAGVDVSALVCDENKLSGTAVIQVAQNGENAIVLIAGANHSFSNEEIYKAVSLVRKEDLLLLQNEINGLETILNIAKQTGKRIALNPSPITETLSRCDLSAVEYLLLNETEGQAMTGKADPESICSVLTGRYPQMQIVLTLGAQGCVYAKGKDRIVQPAMQAEPVDTTAAGDTFTGYFLTAALTKGDIPYALRLASQASAIAVSRPGASTSIPLIQEVLERLES